MNLRCKVHYTGKLRCAKVRHANRRRYAARKGKQMVIGITLSMPTETHMEEGVGYVSRCIPLDVSSQGVTEDQARENLVEAVWLFLESCIEREVLFQVLSECGVTIESESAPALEHDTSLITLPIPLLLTQRVASNFAN